MKFYSYLMQVGKQQIKRVSTSFENAKVAVLEYHVVPENSIKLLKETELIFVNPDDVKRYFHKEQNNLNIRDFLSLVCGTIYEHENYFYVFTDFRTREFRLHKQSKRVTTVINQKNFTH